MRSPAAAAAAAAALPGAAPDQKAAIGLSTSREDVRVGALLRKDKGIDY